MSHTQGEIQGPGHGVPARTPRDLRLDFFRGLAMFIILLAHTPGNTWTLWIPARFGFSDAAEIFVFASGMASALAFGRLFVRRGWMMGSARVVFRVWQVYWAHIGIFLITAGFLFAVDNFGIGLEGKRYIASPYVVPFFTKTGEALTGLMSLTYVPGLFDILPMYLVILAMIPVVMLFYRLGGRQAAGAFVVIVWVAANLAGYARLYGEEEGSALHELAVWAGQGVAFLNLPSNPFGKGTWFFNPFGWQIVFFSGFAFGMGWLPAPPVRRWLLIAAAVVVMLTLPLAWHKLFNWQSGYLPESWGGAFLTDVRQTIEPLRWKTWVGGWRFVHFLALAYLAWAAVGPGGVKLREGFRAIGAARPAVLIVAGIVAFLTVPYAYVDEIKALAPALDRFFLENIPLIPGNQIGIAQLAHLAALMVLVWAAIGAGGRHWFVRDGFLATVPVIRKVGTQSLAVFMTSIPLARFNGWWLDMIGRDVWTRALVNLTGFAVLIAVAYTVSWFKDQPWRRQPQPATRVAAPRIAGVTAEPMAGREMRGSA